MDNGFGPMNRAKGAAGAAPPGRKMNAIILRGEKHRGGGASVATRKGSLRAFGGENHGFCVFALRDDTFFHYVGEWLSLVEHLVRDTVEIH